MTRACEVQHQQLLFAFCPGGATDIERDMRTFPSPDQEMLLLPTHVGKCVVGSGGSVPWQGWGVNGSQQQLKVRDNVRFFNFSRGTFSAESKFIGDLSFAEIGGKTGKPFEKHL